MDEDIGLQALCFAFDPEGHQTDSTLANWTAAMFDPVPGDDVTNSTWGGGGGLPPHDANFSERSPSALEDAKHYLNAVIHPVLCAMGIVGNMLNLVVLTRGRVKQAMEGSMEKSAHLGLISLALSDMFYCMTGLPDAFLSRQQTVFTSRGFWLYVQIYGPCFQNIFMNTSTWLTVIMAAGRYVAICRPLHARALVEVRATRVAVLAAFIIWSLLHLPSFWTYRVVAIACHSKTLYILDQGYFVLHFHMKMACSYVWSIIGYLVPVLILAYCNFHLILALRQSYRMRRLYRVHTRRSTDSSQITHTLVAVVCMFIILVSPSEILQFCFYSINQSQVETLNFLIVVTNILHTMNFSLNFILYCIINRNFRRTLMCFRRKRYDPVSVEGGGVTPAASITRQTNQADSCRSNQTKTTTVVSL